MTNIPDLRGVFVRGQDNSKGYDTGRALGSYQQDAYVSHSHTIVVASNPLTPLLTFDILHSFP